jgi:hypothetical protein
VTSFATELPDHPVALAVGRRGGLFVLSMGTRVYTGSVNMIKYVGPRRS